MTAYEHIDVNAGVSVHQVRNSSKCDSMLSPISAIGVTELTMHLGLHVKRGTSPPASSVSVVAEDSHHRH